MMAHTHDDIETRIKNIVYRKHIRYLEFETREVLEWEMSNQNIKYIGTGLDKTRLDNNQMTQSADSSKHSKTYKLGVTRTLNRRHLIRRSHCHWT